MIKSKLDRALEVSATVHRLQLRKGTGLPYIIHPVSVMLIASRVTSDEDTLCVCLLHDVLEDVKSAVYSESDMIRDFGANVTDMVKVVTKNDHIPGWRARNEDYMNTVGSSHNPGALIVCAADKIHNLTSVLADHEEIGDELWARFNAGQDQQKWWYRSVLALLEEEMPESPLVAQLSGLVKQLEVL